MATVPLSSTETSPSRKFSGDVSLAPSSSCINKRYSTYQFVLIKLVFITNLITSVYCEGISSTTKRVELP